MTDAPTAEQPTPETQTPEPIKVIVSFPAILQIVKMYTPGTDTGKLVGDTIAELHEILREHDSYLQQLPVSVDRFPDIPPTAKVEEVKEEEKAVE